MGTFFTRGNFNKNEKTMYNKQVKQKKHFKSQTATEKIKPQTNAAPQNVQKINLTKYFYMTSVDA